VARNESKRMGKGAEGIAEGGGDDRGERVGYTSSAANLQKLLERFAEWMQSGRGSLEKIITDLDLQHREFRKLLSQAYHSKAIQVKPPEDAGLEGELANSPQLGGPRYRVLDVGYDDFFYKGAATVVLEELQQLLGKRRDKRAALHLGCVSGRTSGGTVAAICDEPWKKYISGDDLPQDMFVYALNVSQTQGFNELSGNANVLAHALARKIKQEYPNKHVEAYGLSTELLQTYETARESDLKAQTRRVLKNTDPGRLAGALQYLKEHQKLTVDEEKQIRDDLKEIEGEGGAAASKLDLVITGVGSSKSSLFRQYCAENHIEVKGLEDRLGIVGDVAYWPVTRTGEQQKLIKDGTEYEFYTAVSLGVLQEISKGEGKKVILVARNDPTGSKVDPIRAAVVGRYCSVVVTDSGTARDLHRTWGR